MFKDIEQIKSFIIWAREQKIKKIKLKGIEVEISDLAFIDSLTTQSQAINSTNSEQNQQDTVDINNDPDLYGSV